MLVRRHVDFQPGVAEVLLGATYVNALPGTESSPVATRFHPPKGCAVTSECAFSFAGFMHKQAYRRNIGMFLVQEQE